jgi:hypothetical protein
MLKAVSSTIRILGIVGFCFYVTGRGKAFGIFSVFFCAINAADYDFFS